MIKNIILSAVYLGIGVLAVLLVAVSAHAQVTTQGGGTGSSSPSGILIGVTGNLHLQTLTVGSNLTLSGTTLSATGGGSSFAYPFINNATTSSITFGGLTVTGAATGCATFTTGVLSSTGIACGSGTTYTGTFPIQVTGSVISSLFSTTTNSGMAQGNLYVGSGGIFQTSNSSTSIFGYLPLNPTRSLTIAGTANQITSSAGAQDLSADRTWTLSLPQALQFPLSFTSTYGTTTYASSTALSTVNFAATNATTSNLTLTGGAANCAGTSALTTNSSGVVGCTAQPQGTVTAIGVTTNQGVSGSSSGGATPNLTLTLGALTGVTSLNGLVVTANTGDITTGTWDGTAIAIVRGGTASTTNLGGILAGNGASAVKSATIGTGISFDGTTLSNSGVTSIVAGSGISISGGTGAVTVTNSAGAYPFTPTAWGTQTVSATSSTLFAAGGVFGTSTIGILTASTSITNQAVKSALVLNSATGLEGAYAGSNPCTNQVDLSISATGVLTCTSIVNAMITNGTIDLTAKVTGSLPVANGGTASTTNLGGILAGNGASAIKSAVIGTGLSFDGTTLTNTGASFGFPFTANTAAIFFGQASNSTTTQIHFGGSPFAVTASSTSVFANASSTVFTNFTSTYLSSVSGNTYIGTTSDSVNTTQQGKLTIDGSGGTTENLIDVFGNTNDFVEYNCQNFNTGTQGECGYSATRNDGNLTSKFMYMGVNSTGFTRTGSAFVGNQGDATLLDTANNLDIAQGTAGQSMYLYNGGTATSSIALTIFPPNAGYNNVFVGSGTASTSPFSAFSIASTSQNAFNIFDQYNTEDLNFNTASTTGSIFTVAATTSPNLAASIIKLFDVDQYGHLTASSTRATPTLGTCTGGATFGVNSNDVTGDVTLTTAVTSCAIVFASAYAVTPEVILTGSGTVSFPAVTAVSTTGFTIGVGAAVTGDKISYIVIQP